MALGSKLVQPFIKGNVEPASIDLLLDDELLIPKTTHRIAFVDLEVRGNNLMESSIIGEQGFVLHPGEFVLGATMETVSLPDHIVGKIIGKSSLERVGLIVNLSAGWIDPGYRGKLTFGMTNMLRVPIILRAGVKICQVMFAYTNTNAEKPYDGRYQDARSVMGTV